MSEFAYYKVKTPQSRYASMNRIISDSAESLPVSFEEYRIDSFEVTVKARSTEEAQQAALEKLVAQHLITEMDAKILKALDLESFWSIELL